jgi:hypothetical protein
VTLAGRPPNGDAVGAVVTLETSGRRQVRLARTGMSYASQADRRLFFAVDPKAAPYRLIVRWPGDRQAEVFELPGPGAVAIRQGSGTRSAKSAPLEKKN